MLGVTYTYIKCNVQICRYNEKGFCTPPQIDGDENITIKDCRCTTFKMKPLRKYRKTK